MTTQYDVTTFQGLIFKLQQYWGDLGCTIVQPLDLEVGAGTSHPATVLGALGPEPTAVAYVQPSRRPTDGRYGDNPNRLQHFYQFQVIIKPSPDNIQELYLNSLRAIGLDLQNNDVRFVEDNWENPTLGAWGIGWEVWLNSMEITQFTFFQQVGGLECKPVTGEITYGIERLAMYIQGIDNVYDLVWSRGPLGTTTYGDVFHQNEVEQSSYNFEYANVEYLLDMFNKHEQEAKDLLSLAKPLPLPAYEKILKAAHCFNLLDARKAISILARQEYILRIRSLTKIVAEKYYQSREELGFPRLTNNSTGDN